MRPPRDRAHPARSTAEVGEVAAHRLARAAASRGGDRVDDLVEMPSATRGGSTSHTSSEKWRKAVAVAPAKPMINGLWLASASARWKLTSAASARLDRRARRGRAARRAALEVLVGAPRGRRGGCALEVEADREQLGVVEGLRPERERDHFADRRPSAAASAPPPGSRRCAPATRGGHPRRAGVAAPRGRSAGCRRRARP